MDENRNSTQSPEPETLAGDADMDDSAAILADITAERDRLSQERSEIYDQSLRLRAEFDNFRKRAQRERAELSEYASMEAVQAMIPVLDDFERALKVETADQEYAKGMELIYQRLLDILEKLGLEPLESEGKQFDPECHQAVDTVKTDEVEDQTVLLEHQRGYNFKGKLLRPAMVRVAVRP